MSTLVMIANVAPGHVNPMLAAAAGLRDRGHRIRFITGRRFADAVERTGVEFVPLREDADFNHESLAEELRAGGIPQTGPRAMRASVQKVFIDPCPGQYATLRKALAEEPADAVLTEFTVTGAAALCVQEQPRPPVIACGIMPMPFSGPDAPPWGPGLAFRGDSIGRLRNRVLNLLVEKVAMRPVQESFDTMLRQETGRTTGGFFMDWARRADGFAQFSVAGFEYPRNDLPDNVHFIGPMPGLPAEPAELPDWWSDLDGTRPVIHVSQGTVANADLGDLVIPTIRALAGSDVLVVATTGGPDVAVLGPLPANVRAAEFIPHDALLPRTSVFVTNGGYGGLNQALRRGVPIVVAGLTEDKSETSRRVGWSGVGIDLRTSNPTGDAVRDAVHAVLSDPSHRRRAEELAQEVADSPGIDGLDRMIAELTRG